MNCLSSAKKKKDKLLLEAQKRERAAALSQKSGCTGRGAVFILFLVESYERRNNPQLLLTEASTGIFSLYVEESG